MKRYIATLALAGYGYICAHPGVLVSICLVLCALLCPSLVSANALPLPNRNAADVGRLAGAGTYGNWSLVWMWMAYTLAW